MSTKGMSVVAARHLVDRLRVPLLVLHDFDQAGFSIIGTLRRSTRRYRFTNAVEVIDAGLRLGDIETHGLQAEHQRLTQDEWTLRGNGATPADVAFLRRDQRVELNMLTSGELVSLIESRLAEQGIAKVIPDAAGLGSAYRRAWSGQRIPTRLPGRPPRPSPPGSRSGRGPAGAGRGAARRPRGPRACSAG